MCLLVLAWHAHPRYRLIVAANRDEFHDRPALPLGAWPEADRLVGGRDLHAGGAWLAVDRGGRFGVVTNYRETLRPRTSAPSRGRLIPTYLGGTDSAANYLDDLEIEAPGFAGFSLLLADGEALWYASNRAEPFTRRLEAGIYGLSNHALDTPWPKVERVRQRFTAQLAATQPDVANLMSLLADREPAPATTDRPSRGSPSDMGQPGLPADWERALSAPFVRHGNYGTRCSTVVMVGHDGAIRIVERRFDANGDQSGETELELNGPRHGPGA
ncbi:MAG: NRDE family protein [Proteobacteria bacterium]|jgi:uncharacterized protein with NRDE domain|nr:NRDE family protein [Pseudomonadota bacterium]